MSTIIPEHQELIQDLAAAIRNRKHHFQEYYSCGTSCCIAGNKVIKDFPRLAKFLPSLEMGRISSKGVVDFTEDELYAWNDPESYAQDAYKLNKEFSGFVFTGMANGYL
jgi:hypothetical protein